MAVYVERMPDPSTRHPKHTAVDPAVIAGQTRLVFEVWRAFAPRSVQAQLSEQRKVLIRKALAQYPLQDVLDAVIGWRYSSFHTGANDRQKVYNSLELILRNAGQIERFAGYTRAAGVSAPQYVPATKVAAPEPDTGLGQFATSEAW